MRPAVNRAWIQDAIFQDQDQQEA